MADAERVLRFAVEIERGPSGTIYAHVWPLLDGRLVPPDRLDVRRGVLGKAQRQVETAVRDAFSQLVHRDGKAMVP